jgi:ABC-type multidrug transport system ATPase subunit
VLIGMQSSDLIDSTMSVSNRLKSTGFVRVEGVVKKFRSKVVVDNVILEVFKNEILTILGPNGSGKTTLMNCLLGIYEADGGAITCGGKNLRSAIRGKIGYCAQNDFIQDFLTVNEHIELVCRLKNITSAAEVQYQMSSVKQLTHLDGEGSRYA